MLPKPDNSKSYRQAFAHSRDGRAILAIDDVQSAIERALPTCEVNSAYIRVWAEPDRRDNKKARPLSMSWWLSKPVQLYMHEQTEFDGNLPKDDHRNGVHMEKLLKGLRDNPKCLGQ